MIKSQIGPVSIKVLVNGQLRRCHLDQLKLRLCNSDLNSRHTVGPDKCLEEVDIPSPPESDKSPRADAHTSQAPLVHIYLRQHNQGQPPIRNELETT